MGLSTKPYVVMRLQKDMPSCLFENERRTFNAVWPWLACKFLQRIKALSRTRRCSPRASRHLNRPSITSYLSHHSAPMGPTTNETKTTARPRHSGHNRVYKKRQNTSNMSQGLLNTYNTYDCERDPPPLPLLPPSTVQFSQEVEQVLKNVIPIAPQSCIKAQKRENTIS